MLNKSDRDSEFLCDLMTRLNRLGLDYRRLSKIGNLNVLYDLLKIYSFDYTEEGKMIGIFNLLDGKKKGV